MNCDRYIFLLGRVDLVRDKKEELGGSTYGTGTDDEDLDVTVGHRCRVFEGYRLVSR